MSEKQPSIEAREDNRALVSSSDYWSTYYQDAEELPPWDAGISAPALRNFLTKGVPMRLEEALQSPHKKALVPGCGNGYDLITLARAGFTPLGLDLVPEAVQNAEASLRREGLPGSAAQRDLFTLGTRPDDQFDLVYEYTCFCAINPDRRAEYAEALRKSIVPGGLLVGLFFPFVDLQGGPPFTVTEDEVKELFHEGFEWLHFGTPAESHEKRQGKERLLLARRVG